MKSGIDPHQDPNGFRKAGDSAIRTIRLKTGDHEPWETQQAVARSTRARGVPVLPSLRLDVPPSRVGRGRRTWRTEHYARSRLPQSQGYHRTMRRPPSVLVTALLASLIACGSTPKPVARIRLSPKGIFDEAVGSIVRVEAGSDKLQDGFIVDKSGIVATNLHVIAGESEIKVRMHDGSFYKVLQIAGLDPGHDLALLKIQPKQALPALQIGDSNAVGPGDQVVAIGNPLGVLDNTVSQGLVGAVRVLCSDQDVVSRASVLAKMGRPVEDIARELSVKKARTNDER